MGQLRRQSSAGAGARRRRRQERLAAVHRRGRRARCGDPTFYEKLEPGVSYDIEKHHSGTRYAVPHLVNIKASRFRWEGVVPQLPGHHGRLESPQIAPRRVDRLSPRPGREVPRTHAGTEVPARRQAARGRSRQNPGNARSQFYLGQSYRDAGHHAKAYVEYKRRAQMQGWAEETFVAQLEAARAAQRIEEQRRGRGARVPPGRTTLRPTRVEPLHDLARYFRTKGKFGKAYAFARTGVELRAPRRSALHQPADLRLAHARRAQASPRTESATSPPQRGRGGDPPGESGRRDFRSRRTICAIPEVSRSP